MHVPMYMSTTPYIYLCTCGPRLQDADPLNSKSMIQKKEQVNCGCIQKSSANNHTFNSWAHGFNIYGLSVVAKKLANSAGTMMTKGMSSMNI